MRNYKYLLVLILMASQNKLVYSEKQYDTDTLSFNSKIYNRVNIIILGDGYTLGEKSTFTRDCQYFLSCFQQSSPFSNYKNYFNVFSIFTESEVSGAANHPDSLINNRFGSTFNYDSVQRLLFPTKTSEVVDVVHSYFPDFDLIVLIVNTPRYGGSGGSIAVSSNHADFCNTIIHEIAHTFATLSDEYWPMVQSPVESPNLTQTSNPTKVKWNNWIGSNGIGVYECGPNSGWFKPGNVCKMYDMEDEFCSVCKESIIQTIYRHCILIDEYSPEDPILDCTNTTTIFKVNTLKPEPNTLETIWYLNTKEIAKNVESIFVDKSILDEGSNYVKVIVNDTTPDVLSMNRIYYFNYMEWLMQNGPLEIEMQNPLTLKILINNKLYTVKLDLPEGISSDLSISIYDINGRMVFGQHYKELLFESNTINLRVPSLMQNHIYFIRIVVYSKALTKKLVL